MIQTTYTQARANLSQLMNEVTLNHETVIINRRDSESVAMISADELSSLLETAHLLRSPKNAQRLMTALNRALTRETTPQTIQELTDEVGLGEEA